MAARLKAIYGSVSNLDAFVGMMAEKHVTGSELGELQLAIWKDQFGAARDGDRFFYQNDPLQTFIRSNFGIDSRKTLAQVIALNTDVPAAALPANVFRLPGCAERRRPARRPSRRTARRTRRRRHGRRVTAATAPRRRRRSPGTTGRSDRHRDEPQAAAACPGTRSGPSVWAAGAARRARDPDTSGRFAAAATSAAAPAGRRGADAGPSSAAIPPAVAIPCSGRAETRSDDVAAARRPTPARRRRAARGSSWPCCASASS